MIEQEAIDQNYAMAMEEAPEVFARVTMLYIDTEVGWEYVISALNNRIFLRNFWVRSFLLLLHEGYLCDEAWRVICERVTEL